MTKRISVILCVLVLLLTGCSRPGDAIPGTSDPADVPIQSESAPRPESSLPTAQPAETEEPTVWVPESSEAQSVTAGGYKVHIDTSQYSPYQPPVSVFIRPEGVDLSEFHPENAHGTVYPYATDVLYSSYEGGYSGEAGYHFGFFDATGTLVTDGIYLSCDPFEVWDYETNSTTGYPFWRVSRTGEIKVVHYESEDFSYDYPEGNVVYGIVAMDGSFCVPCEYVTIVENDGKLICRKNFDAVNYVVYDLSGNPELSNVEGFFDPNSDWQTLNYGDGLYVACSGFNDKNPECYYVDASGQRLLGPYVYANPFQDGLACVSADGERYGLVDKTGAWVIPPRYNSISSFTDGKAIARNDTGTEVIDRAGNVILEKKSGLMGYFSREAYGFCYSEGSYSEIYDKDCNLLMSGYGDWSWMDETVFYRTQGTGIVVHSLDESIPDLYVPNQNYLTKGYAYFDGSLHEGYVNDNYSDRTVTYVAPDLSEWRLIERDAADYYMMYLDSFTPRDLITREEYCCVKEGGKWLIFNSALEQVGVSDVPYPNIIGGMVRSLIGLSCTYETMDGQLVFSFPYLGGGD